MQAIGTQWMGMSRELATSLGHRHAVELTVTLCSDELGSLPRLHEVVEDLRTNAKRCEMEGARCEVQSPRRS